ncbi:hypothetical protein CYMTET_18893 [Cymbomonas tetramitiformis]|uniref:Uncharacterized protein n=1 Tax=Cymbomonas tetramitiformis TaxID=36881 RepID=A0AAE0G8H3_9CHLO|nr:hypothetical protein CYMTET_18893 [Cymbomonas tetramitiformis]
MSADRVSLASRLRAARSGSASPDPSPGPDRSEADADDPAVPMSTLISRPTPVSRAPTSAEFHADATIWSSTPVRPSQRSEFAEKLDYAFAYGEELAKLLRSHGFKVNVGLSLDGPDAEADFAVFRANMAHFIRATGAAPYNAFVFMLRALATPIPTVSGFAFVPSSVLDETVEPAPQLSGIRTFADKHRKLHSDYGDRNLVEDLYCVLRSSAAMSPDVTPLYLVVLRELGTTNDFTFSSLALRLGKIFRDESHLARLHSPAAPESGGATARTGGGVKDTAGSVHSMGRRKYVPPEETWKKNDTGGRYLVWHGTGVPCVTCFRLWGVTTGHMDSDRAHALRLLEAPPQDAEAQPPAMMSVRVPAMPPPGADVQLPAGWVPGIVGMHRVGGGDHDPQPYA